jgi:hypothetical protein
MADLTDPLDDRDATEHLIRAGREVLAAARSTIDALDAFLATMEERHGAAKQKPSTVQAIPIRRSQV